MTRPADRGAQEARTAREVLVERLRALRLQDEGGDEAELLDPAWFRARLGGRLRRVFPTLGFRRALVLHDLHHALTGLGIGLEDELRLAAWELGSGGCGWHLVFWADRLGALLLGLLTDRDGVRAAFRAGRASRNLYGVGRRRALATDFDVLRRFVRLPAEGLAGLAPRVPVPRGNP